MVNRNRRGRHADPVAGTDSRSRPVFSFYFLRKSPLISSRVRRLDAPPHLPLANRASSWGYRIAPMDASIDAMWRLASTPGAPMCMEPEEHAALTTSAVLPKRYFVPKPPTPRSPPNSECTPRRHEGAGPPHSPEPTACRRTALQRGGGTA